MAPDYEGHTPIGVCDVLGSYDCPGPYSIHVTSVPRRHHNQLTLHSGNLKSQVATLSDVTGYGDFDYPEVFEILAIFTERRLSPYDGLPVDTCLRLPYALCRDTGKAFDLVDAVISIGLAEVEKHIAGWLTGSVGRLQQMVTLRKEFYRSGTKLPISDLLNRTVLSPRSDLSEAAIDEED